MNYAAIYSCGAVLSNVRRENAAILSRSRALDQNTLDDLRKLFDDFNLPNFREVDQEVCSSEGDSPTIVINEPTLESIKEMLNIN